MTNVAAVGWAGTIAETITMIRSVRREIGGAVRARIYKTEILIAVVSTTEIDEKIERVRGFFCLKTSKIKVFRELSFTMPNILLKQDTMIINLEVGARETAAIKDQRSRREVASETTPRTGTGTGIVTATGAETGRAAAAVSGPVVIMEILIGIAIVSKTDRVRRRSLVVRIQ